MRKCSPCAISLLHRRRRSPSSTRPPPPSDRHHHRYCYGSVFSFGDSFADTGNKPVAFARYSVPVPVMRPPYGETFFAGHPTGCTTDGCLILDFIAERLVLPFVPPSLARNGSFGLGVNFAVAGATALDAGFFHDKDIPGAPSKFPLNTSLHVQMDWFEELKPSLCGSTQECKEFLGKSLFVVGEFGVNDYHLSLEKLSVHRVRSFIIPRVIRTISTAIKRLIKHGATSLVVPWVIPSGCSLPILTMLADHAHPSEYDARTGCLKALNELGIHHNTLLQRSLRRLRAKHPGVSIVYADFLSLVMEMIESPRKFGECCKKMSLIDRCNFLFAMAGLREDVLQVCCGGPGRYNEN